MPRRSFRRSRSRSRNTDDSAPGIAALFAAMMVYRWFSELSLLWRIASSVFAVSLIIVGVWLFTRFIRRRRRERLMRADVVALTPTEFEHRVALLLEDLGWEQVQRRGGSGDRGVDVVGVRDGLRYVVQCKYYKNAVAPAMVRDFVGTLHIQKYDRGILVTTSRFTQQGYLEARDQPVDLWDGAELARQMRLAEEQRSRQDQPHTRPWLFFGGLAAVNTLALALALTSPLLVASRPEQTSAVVAIPTLIRSAEPTPISQPTTQLATPPALTTAVVLTATVFNGGNVRATPDLQGSVLDQIHAHELVHLLGRTADGQWYRIRDARNTIGWTHQSLLTIPQAEQARVSVEAP